MTQNVQFPFMRIELLSCLESLSDWEYQKECWVKQNCPPGVCDNFDLSVHFLFDDTNLSKNAEDNIGYIIKNSEEANAVSIVCEVIDQILVKYSTKLTDEQYIHKPEWQNVISAAVNALAVLRKSP